MKLIDIEPPAMPNLSWFQNSDHLILLGTLGALAFIMLFAILLLKTRHRLTKTSKLRLQLQKLHTQISSSQSSVSPQQRWQLYQTGLELKALITTHSSAKYPASSHHTHPTLGMLNTLLNQMEPLCFSTQPVSRETYLQLLLQLQRLLEQHSYHRLSLKHLLTSVHS